MLQTNTSHLLRSNSGLPALSCRTVNLVNLCGEAGHDAGKVLFQEPSVPLQTVRTAQLPNLCRQSGMLRSRQNTEFHFANKYSVFTFKKFCKTNYSGMSGSKLLLNTNAAYTVLLPEACQAFSSQFCWWAVLLATGNIGLIYANVGFLTQTQRLHHEDTVTN